MIYTFSNQEKEYEEWCNQNKHGYVFNNAGGKTGNVLHNVSCTHLSVPSRNGTYTTRYKKYCSTDINEISETGDRVSLPYGWRRCKACFKDK